MRDHAAQGEAPASRGLSAHHTPDFCPYCAAELIRYDMRTYDEPFWWCRTCHAAHWCACEGCEVMRALRRDW